MGTPPTGSSPAPDQSGSSNPGNPAGSGRQSRPPGSGAQPAPGTSGRRRAPGQSGPLAAPGRAGQQTGPAASGVTRKAGRFQIGQAIAENDFSRLLVATDTSRNSPVLLRRFKPEIFDNANAWAKFQQQLQALARTSIDGVLPVESVFGSGPKTSLLITGTAGDTLRAKFQQDNVQEMAGDVLVIAETLDRMHRAEHVHGDVRPETVFYDGAGQPLLGEFVSHWALCGWKPGQQTVPVDMPGRLFPADRIAPEVRQGGTASPRADQYALALICLEAFLHVRPRGGEPLAMLTSEHVPADKQQTLEVLRPALQRALALDPAQRFPTCRDFAVTVRDALQSTEKPTTGQRLLTWGVPAALIAAMLVVWVFVSGWRVRARAEEQKQSQIAEVAEAYQTPVPSLTAPRPADSLTRLDPMKPSKAQEYVDRQLQRDDEAHQQQRAMLRSAFLGGGSASLSLTSPATMQPSCAFWYDGRSQILPVAADGGTPFEVDVTVGKTFDSPVTVFLAIHDQQDRPLTPPVRAILEKDNSRLTLSGTLRPNLPDGTWEIGSQLQAELSVQFPGEDTQQAWVKTTSPLQIGGVQSTISKVQLSPAKLLAGGNGYAHHTGIALGAGETINLKVSGTVRLSSEDVYGLLTGNRNRTDIGAKGVTVVESASRYRLLSNSENNWGALLYRIGDSASWQRPTLKATGNTFEYTSTLSSRTGGQLDLSIDSVTREEYPVGSKILRDVDPAERFWKDDGHFDVELSRRQFFPANLPATTRQQIEKLLE